MRGRILLLCSLILLANSALANPTTFEVIRPFPTEKSELTNLWEIPLEPTGYEVKRAYRSANINVEEIYYQSRDYKGDQAKIFGFYCYPNYTKPLPAILISHGGGGTAKLRTAVNWAKRGYAVLAIDLPGKGFQRAGSRSTGPDMDVPILLRTTPDPSYNYLVHAVAAIRNGITFLTCREEVDSQRIGLVGLSWGGVLTLLTNGQDTRLKTAVNIFGAGYIPEGCTWQDRFQAKSPAELADWYRLIDPKNFLTSQHAPILFLTGTNDHCYYLPTFQKSYAAVTVPKNLVLIPNLKHQFLPAEQAIVLAWLDSKLKTGQGFPTLQLAPLLKNNVGKLIIPAVAKAAGTITKATLSYTLGGPSQWTTRQWVDVKGYLEDGTWYFGLPTILVQPHLLFFVTVRDNYGGVASTPVHSLFKVQIAGGDYTYAMSAPIQKNNHLEQPLQILGQPPLPTNFALSFSKQNQTYTLRQ